MRHQTGHKHGPKQRQSRAKHEPQRTAQPPSSLTAHPAFTADGSAARQLTSFPAKRSAGAPWSPNGVRIAFMSDADGWRPREASKQIRRDLGINRSVDVEISRFSRFRPKPVTHWNRSEPVSSTVRGIATINFFRPVGCTPEIVRRPIRSQPEPFGWGFVTLPGPGLRNSLIPSPMDFTSAILP